MSCPPRRTKLAGLVAGAALAGTAFTGTASAVNGPDVSAWQHPQSARIEWQRVAAAGNGFVFIKAAEGRSYVNPWWASDREGAMAAGMAVGAYEFAEPGVASALVQARHFARVVGSQTGRGELPPVLDLEQTGGLHARRLIAWIGRWLGTVHRLTHRMPIIYTSPSFWAANLHNTRRYAQYPLWVADWGVSAPKLFGGWHHWLFWQYTSAARVAGVRGRIDEDRYAGTDAQFRALAHLGAAPAAASAPRRGSGRAAARRKPTWLHLLAPHRRHRRRSVRLAGRLNTAGGRGVRASRIVLQARKQHGGWRSLGRVWTHAGGRFRRTLHTGGRLRVRAVYAGNRRYLPDASHGRTVHARRRRH